MLDIPQLREGQTVRVFQKFVDGKRERNVPFMGLLLKVRGSGINQMITIKQHLEGVDVEKIIPVRLPTITKIEIIQQVKSLEKGEATTKKKSKKARKSSKPRTKKK